MAIAQHISQRIDYTVIFYEPDTISDDSDISSTLYETYEALASNDYDLLGTAKENFRLGERDVLAVTAQADDNRGRPSPLGTLSPY